MVDLGVLRMFTKEQIQGILLSLARPELAIFQNSKKQIGYEVRVRVVIRGEFDFLTAIERSLLQYNVESKIKMKESKVRPLPVLRVSQIGNLCRLCNLVPNLPDAKNKWESFKAVIDLMYHGKHMTQKGLDEILQFKGAV